MCFSIEMNSVFLSVRIQCVCRRRIACIGLAPVAAAEVAEVASPCHQREPCLCEEAGEQGGRPEEELRRLQQAREEALYKKAIASSLAPARGP